MHSSSEAQPVSVSRSLVILLLLIGAISSISEALPLMRKRALDHLDGDDFTSLRKRALDLMEGDGFGFEKRALDHLDGDDFSLRKRSLDSLDGDGFTGLQRKRALDMLEGDSWGGIDKRRFGMHTPATLTSSSSGRAQAMRALYQRQPLLGQRLIKIQRRALDALDGNSFGF
jgi:hypothetical protein